MVLLQERKSKHNPYSYKNRGYLPVQRGKILWIMRNLLIKGIFLDDNNSGISIHSESLKALAGQKHYDCDWGLTAIGHCSGCWNFPLLCDPSLPEIFIKHFIWSKNGSKSHFTTKCIEYKISLSLSVILIFSDSLGPNLPSQGSRRNTCPKLSWTLVRSSSSNNSWFLWLTSGSSLAGRIYPGKACWNAEYMYSCHHILMNVRPSSYYYAHRSLWTLKNLSHPWWATKFWVKDVNLLWFCIARVSRPLVEVFGVLWFLVHYLVLLHALDSFLIANLWWFGG